MKCEASIWFVHVLYSNLGKLSIAAGVIAALAHVIYYAIKNRELALNVAVGKMLAGTVIPPAFLMGCAAFDPPNLLGCVTNVEIYIVVGAFCTIWIALTICFPGGFTWEWIRRLGDKLKPPSSSLTQTKK
jgi:hypothetical protein